MSTPPMARAPLVSLRANEARRWFLDQQTWIRVGTEQSGGSVAIVEHLIPAAAESPWHVHHVQDESIYVLEGSITVVVGDDHWTLGPGDYAFGPPRRVASQERCKRLGTQAPA
jgi:quercetin dioxygenase-like cupin family protein